MDAGRRDALGQALEGAEVAALGSEAWLLTAYRAFKAHNVLPHAGGWLDQDARISANLQHYLNGIGAARDEEQSAKMKPSAERASSSKWAAYFEERDDG